MISLYTHHCAPQAEHVAVANVPPSTTPNARRCRLQPHTPSRCTVNGLEEGSTRLEVSGEDLVSTSEALRCSLQNSQRGLRWSLSSELALAGPMPFCRVGACGRSRIVERRWRCIWTAFRSCRGGMLPPKGYIVARHVSDTQFVEADIKVYCWPQQMSNSSKRYIDRLAFSLTLCLKTPTRGGHHGAVCRELRMEPRVTSLIQCRVA